MLVTWPGMVKEDMSRPEKAFVPIEVTLLGMVLVMPPTINELVSVSMIALQLSRESYFGFPDSTSILLMLGHPKNAKLSMSVTLLGKVMNARLGQ